MFCRLDKFTMVVIIVAATVLALSVATVVSKYYVFCSNIT